MKTAFLKESIISAINEGVAWTPSYYAAFQTKKSDGTHATAAENARWQDFEGNNAALNVDELGDGTNPDQARVIPASLLRSIFARCEDDDWRDQQDPGISRKSNTDANAEIPYGMMVVARFGVRIEEAVIIGYLDLSGFEFKRPITFKSCRFTHTVNLANARLGPVSFEGCRFDTAPINADEALNRYPIDGAAEASIGFLPPLMMLAQGINAHSASFNGYVDLGGIRAQRLDFYNAKLTDLLDLEHAEILLPDFFGRKDLGGLHADLPQRAIELGSARGQSVFFSYAKINGQVSLTSGTFDSLFFEEARISAHRQHFGSLGVAIYARNLRLDSDLVLRNSGSNPCICGSLDFENSEFGGEVKFEGISIDLGLSGEHNRVLAECAHGKDGLAYRERAATRAIVLRNCRIEGMLKFSKLERSIHELGGGHGKSGSKHKHPEDQFFRCNGELDLRSIDVEDDIRFEGCLLTNDSVRTTVIDLRDSQTKRVLLFKNMNRNSRGDIDLREARAAVYRDDFDHVYDFVEMLKNKVGMTFEILLYRPAIIAIVVGALLIAFGSGAKILSIFIVFLGILGVTDLFIGLPSMWRKLRSLWNSKQTWPRDLNFALSGFVYDAFPIRDLAPTADNSDSSRMALTHRARVRWLLQQDSVWLKERFQPQPWVQCAKVLGHLGYDRQSHELLRMREVKALGSDNVGLPEKVIRSFLVVTCGGGHNMIRLVGIGFFFFLISLFFNTAAINSNLMRPTNVPLLVNSDYRQSGNLPYEYSTLRPWSFTLRMMFPLPSAMGGSEWAACSGRQISQAIESGSNGACVPKKCSIAMGDCERLSTAANNQNYADVTAALPEQVRKVIIASSGEEWLNKFIMTGGARLIDKISAAVGWLIIVILGTYATGSLKRHE